MMHINFKYFKIEGTDLLKWTVITAKLDFFQDFEGEMIFKRLFN